MKATLFSTKRRARSPAARRPGECRGRHRHHTGRDLLQEHLNKAGLPAQKITGSPLLADVIREAIPQQGSSSESNTQQGWNQATNVQ